MICKGGLSKRQFGHITRRSTVHASLKVVQVAREPGERLVVVDAMHIRNTFISASWSRIIEVRGEEKSLTICITTLVRGSSY